MKNEFYTYPNNWVDCMESKSLTKTYAFRENACLEITVTFYEDEIVSDCYVIGKESKSYDEIKIYVDGKYVAKGDKAFVYNTEMQNIEATRIGNKYIKGHHADQIKAIINNLYDELAPQFSEQTITQKQEAAKQKEVTHAERILETVKTYEKILTPEAWKAYIKSYNDLYNEGGEGYLPPCPYLTTDIEWANKILNK